MNMISRPEQADRPQNEELIEIGRQIATLECRLHQLRAMVDPGASGQQATAYRSGEGHAVKIRAYLRARRLRERLLPPDLFADPAWDMLLDLYAAGIEGVSVSISSACIAAAVPPTTALRWIGRLQREGLICRLEDRHDARRHLLRLSTSAEKIMDKWVTVSLD